MKKALLIAACLALVTGTYAKEKFMHDIRDYGAIADGHQITVVGEVPAATVEMMARSTVSTAGAGR